MQKLNAAIEAAPVNETVVENIRKLQFLQFQHDREYHPDIFNLTPAEKLTHFVLHLNKYAPKLMTWHSEAMHNNEAALDYLNTLTDFGIILLSMANVFQLRLGQYTAERGDEYFQRIGPTAVSAAFHKKRFGDSTATQSTLFMATIDLMKASGEASDVMIQHFRLEGNIRNKMTNLIHAMWENYHVAFWALYYEHDFIRGKSYDEHMRDRLVYIESRNTTYAERPKYAEDFATPA